MQTWNVEAVYYVGAEGEVVSHTRVQACTMMQAIQNAHKNDARVVRVINAWVIA